MRRSLVAVALLLFFAGCATTSPRDEEKALRTEIRKPNKSSPRYVTQQANRRVFVFIHGIFGDAFGTWRNANGKHFFDHFADDPVFAEADVYVYGFPSQFFGGGYSVQQAASNMQQRLRDDGVLDYEQIVIVCHSMGGLVAEQFLLDYPAVAKKVPLLFFFSTPQEGAAIARLADRVLANPALKNMVPLDSNNDYLATLDNSWKLRQADGTIPTVIRCAYETQSTLGILVVPLSSGTRFCVGASAPVFANHMAIVKPEDRKSDAYIALRNAVRDIPRPLPPPVETFSVDATIAPIGDVLTTVIENFHVDDGSDDCDININKTVRYTLREGERVVAIGSPVVSSSNCPTGASHPIPGSERVISPTVVEIAYHLQGCGRGPLGIGCNGRGWLVFDVPITAARYAVNSPLRPVSRQLSEQPLAAPAEIIYTEPLPQDARNVVWNYTATVNRVLRRGSEIMSRSSTSLSRENPSAAGFVSEVKDGRLIVRFVGS